MLGVSRKTVSKIINRHGAITTEMALRLEIVFLTSAQAWLNMQTAYDLWHMAKVRKSLTATFHPMAAEVSLQRKITGQVYRGCCPNVDLISFSLTRIRNSSLYFVQLLFPCHAQ